MAGGIEGERPHGERTSQQPRQPENPQPQQESQEHRPLPSVLDILERRAQLSEMAIARERRKFSREENRGFDEECRAVVDQLTDEKARLYSRWREIKYQ